MEKSNDCFSILVELEKQLPYFLVSVGIEHEQEAIERPFGYPYYQWIQTVEGEGEVRIGEKGLQKVVEGEAILLFPQESHGYNSSSPEGWKVCWYTFGGHHIRDLLTTLKIYDSGVYRLSHHKVLEAHIHQGLGLLQAEDSLRFLDCSASVYSFILDLNKYTIRDGESFHRSHYELRKIFNYIEENYSKPISIDKLAGVMGYSPQYFCQIFKRAMNMRPFEYLNIFRVNKSKTLLLRHPELSLHEVAKMAGYDSESYFSTVFRKQEKMSPRSFRELNRLK